MYLYYPSSWIDTLQDLCNSVVIFDFIPLILKPPSSPEAPSSSMPAPPSAPSYVPKAASNTSQAPAAADTLSESTINLKRELEVRLCFLTVKGHFPALETILEDILQTTTAVQCKYFDVITQHCLFISCV